MRRTNPLASSLLLITVISAVLLSSVATLNAQHVQYKTKSKMDLKALGFFARFLDSEMVEEVSISGNIKRVNRKNSSTITNLDTEQIINLDHKRKEYSIVTFDDMIAMFKDAAEYGEIQIEEARADIESNEDAPEYKVNFDLRVEDTGKSKKIDGKKAFQKVLIIETLFEPEDEAAADTLPSTALYAVNDLWLSDDVPEMKVNGDFNRRMGEIMQEQFSQMNMSNIVSALMKSDPRVSDAMDKAQEAIDELSGTTLLSTLHLVTVPPDMDLDLALALGEKKKPKKKGGGFGGFLKKSIQIEGFNISGDEDEEDKILEQKTLFSMISRTTDIKDKARKPDYYVIPDDYDEVEFEFPKLMQTMQPE